MKQINSVTRKIQAQKRHLSMIELNGSLAVLSETISATILSELYIFDRLHQLPLGYILNDFKLAI